MDKSHSSHPFHEVCILVKDLSNCFRNVSSIVALDWQVCVEKEYCYKREPIGLEKCLYYFVCSDVSRWTHQETLGGLSPCKSWHRGTTNDTVASIGYQYAAVKLCQIPICKVACETYAINALKTKNKIRTLFTRRSHSHFISYGVRITRLLYLVSSCFIPFQ